MGNSLGAFKLGSATAKGFAKDSAEKKRLEAERNKSRGQRAQERSEQLAEEEFDLEKELGKNPELLNSILGIRTGEVDAQGRPISQSEDITPNKKKKTNTVSSNSRPSILSLAGLNKRNRKSILGTAEEESIIGG